MLSPGDVVGDYEIEELIGAGGMAVVYRARHRILGSTHAVKILKPHLVRSEEQRERFLAEGRIQARIKHSSIVEVTGVLVEPGVAGLVMAYLDGPTLTERIAECSLSIQQIEDIILPLLDGVAAVHALDIVHRDLKPDNIKLLADGRPVLFDFGVARLISAGAEATVGHRQKFRTRAGRRMGTPGYMSPEQIEGDLSVNARTDVFALGCILYELISGEKAYDGESDFTIMKAIVDGAHAPLAGLTPEAPAALVACAERAMSRSPGDRPADAAALRTDVVRALASATPEEKPAPTAPILRHRRWPVLLLLALLSVTAAGIGGGAWAWSAARAAQADRLAAEAMVLLEHHKTDEKANQDPAILLAARSTAQEARDVASTPAALGAVALTTVWSQGWQLARFDADAVNAHLHEIDVLSQQAARAGSGEGALARALVASTACAQLTAADPRRAPLCADASRQFEAAARALDGDDRAWLRFEVWWTGAEHHNRLAAGWWAAGARARAQSEWRHTLVHCRAGTRDITAAPVNDVFLARQCLIAAGGAGQYSEYVGWGRWLAGHDLATEGAVTDWSLARIYRAAHPDCRALPRARISGSAWTPVVDTAAARRCHHAGLLTLSCDQRARGVLTKPDRVHPMVQGIARAAGASRASCLL